MRYASTARWLTATLKNRLYPDLIRCAEIALKQTAKAIEQVARQAMADGKAKVWIDEVEHYRGLLLRIIDQTRRRVLHGESVRASETCQPV